MLLTMELALMFAFLTRAAILLRKDSAQRIAVPCPMRRRPRGCPAA